MLPLEKVTAFVDGQSGVSEFLGKPVISPEALAACHYDLILVTTRQADAVAARCKALGIDLEKVLFLKNNFTLTDRNLSYGPAREILGDEFIEKLQSSQRLIRSPLWSDRERLPSSELDNDYVRLKTLDALTGKLGEVPGAVAELGVFKGGFARCLNALMPERRLYLFDTFTGFDPSEVSGCGTGFIHAHQNTALEAVRARLPFPVAAVFREGLFPATAEGLEGERFALVSLDVDLEESTYQGLSWFLPRLSPGGYLLLHDYNNPKLPGVKAAIGRYEREHGRLPAVPLCDCNGTLVICGI